MASRAEKLNRGFFSRMQRGRPFVRIKIAASLDGATAMANGESQWITGKEARLDVQRLRAECGAILTGIGTVLADDPSLTVRDTALTTVQPLRAVVDSELRTPPSACMLALDGETIIFCVDDSRRAALEKTRATVHRCGGEDGRVDLQKALRFLAGREVNDLLVEAGPVIAGAFLSQHMADELVIYLAPHIMGSETRGMFDTPGWTTLTDRLELTINDVRQVGNDMRITAAP
jgi:diaminohydroxyphosphoribosylaminopyrimidine deaminase/5-amino-6-(5-phosphoribosylamino)uracil reductase